MMRRHKPRVVGSIIAGDGRDHLTATPPCATQRARPNDELEQLRRLAGRIARLNPDSATIGGGMLRSLVDDARRALGQEGGAR